MSLSNQIILILLTTGLPDVRPSPEIDNEVISNLQETVQTQKGTNLYDHNGANWPGLCKTGNLQSPIDIDPHVTSDVPSALPIVFINYNLCTFKFEVTPTTIYLHPVIQHNHELGIAAGGLRGLYRLESAHFHWNAEHTINNKRDALELHVVHYKTIYSGIAEANNHENGLAVLAILYKIGQEDSGVAKLIEAIESKSNNSSLTAEELLPEETNEYYRYAGSLTTPGCEESVIWTIFKTQRTISKKQSEWFKNLQLKEGTVLVNNYRLVQKTKRRKVYHATASFV
ncbi:carbonic anhydrase 2-like isoform X2 [Cimex lectularius]|nr:carbonic anhydrase 2-like isoform X2 [Cimex lectularius]